MCTLKESKLFIDTINNIPAKESIEFIFDDLYASLLEEEFPVKDRSISRKHNSSRRKAKEKNRTRKETAYQRSYNLYHAGFDENGRSFKYRSMEQFADIDERDFINGDTREIIEEPEMPEPNWFYMLSRYTFSDIPTDIVEGLKVLNENGIYLDAETEIRLLNTIHIREYNLHRRNQIYSEREIIGYEVYSYEDFGQTNSFGIFPTRELAEEMVAKLRKKEYDVYTKTIKMFTEEQAREMIDLDLF